MGEGNASLTYFFGMHPIEARVKAGTAKYIETLDIATMNEIIDRVISVIDPAEE